MAERHAVLTSTTPFRAGGGGHTRVAIDLPRIPVIDDGKLPCVRVRPPAQVGERSGEAVMRFPFEIQGQWCGAQEFVLEQPGLLMFDPCDKGVLPHPPVQPPLAGIRKRHPPATSDPAQREAVLAHRLLEKPL